MFIYIYIYVYVYICIYIYTHICIYVYIRANLDYKFKVCPLPRHARMGPRQLYSAAMCCGVCCSILQCAAVQTLSLKLVLFRTTRIGPRQLRLQHHIRVFRHDGQHQDQGNDHEHPSRDITRVKHAQLLDEGVRLMVARRVDVVARLCVCVFVCVCVYVCVCV